MSKDVWLHALDMKDGRPNTENILKTLHRKCRLQSDRLQNLMPKRGLIIKDAGFKYRLSIRPRII